MQHQTFKFKNESENGSERFALISGGKKNAQLHLKYGSNLLVPSNLEKHRECHRNL